MDIDAAITAFAAATKGDLYETKLDQNGEPWGWMIEAVETQESIEDYLEAANGYRECSAPQRGEIAGFPFVAFRSVQLRRGMPRRALSVIDLGQCRYALDVDLTCYA